MLRVLRSLAPAAAALLLAAASDAAAQSAATVTVHFEVRSIQEIALSGTPAPLVVRAASAGQPPAPASDRSTTWSVTANEAGGKVTAATEPLPDGVTLSVSLAAPAGAASAGLVPLGPEARDLVTGLPAVRASGLPVEYSLSATPRAGVVPAATAQVTFTLTAGV